MGWGLYYATVPLDAKTTDALHAGFKSSYRELSGDDVEEAKADASRIMARVSRSLERQGRCLSKVCIFPTTRRSSELGCCYLWTRNHSWRPTRKLQAGS